MPVIVGLDPHRQQMLDSYLHKIGVTFTKAVDGFLTNLSGGGGVKVIPDFVFKRAMEGYHLVFCSTLDDDLLDDQGYSDEHIDDLCANLREVIKKNGRHQFIFAGQRWKVSKNPNVRIRPAPDTRSSNFGMEFSLEFAADLLAEIERVRRRDIELLTQLLGAEHAFLIGIAQEQPSFRG